MTSTRNRILVATLLVALAGIATAQNSAAPAKTADKQWVAPGTPGSEIDGTVFHAQVLLNANGFSTGVIPPIATQGTSNRLVHQLSRRGSGRYFDGLVVVS